MKATFKPLGLAAAVAAVSAGYTGVANAQTLADNSGLGDLAIIPYYTVQGSFATGVSFINTSNLTQVVKVRLRRASDSMDALDFNVIMSPEDVWTGYIQKDGEEIRFYTNDTSCTAPATTNGYFEMPDIYREGAEEGYIEVIGMGSADAAQPISIAALHKSADRIPLDCDRVRDNFFPGANPADYGSAANLARRGVISSVQAHQYTSATNTTPRASFFGDTGNVLKVSYFIKSDETGIEFGNDAVHIADFMDGASITNQKVGVFEGDLQGFDHPDLNGGAPTSVFDGVVGAAGRGAYEGVRNAIGAGSVINDWSKNQTDNFTVDTDWVVTTPGQYLMLNLGAYLQSIDPAQVPDTECLPGDPALAYDAETGDNCDFRDIPMTASVFVVDREEQGIIIDEGDLVVSPQPPGERPVNILDQEVNVITWGAVPVLDAAKQISVPTPEGSPAGWASLSVTANAEKTQAICDFTALAAVPIEMPVECTATDTPVPLVGFVAWQRNFANLPAANYGRIVEHSYASS